ncbi:hypothetical protein SDC9_137732 [bioreactor metagenome]|uniref:Uncharacterized protein n=1 Tax=bioreactor metagenome TaxID=1076179 RepID=A0A645DMX0_9ZZZZ
MGHAQRLVQGLCGQRGPVGAACLRHGFARSRQAEVGVCVAAVGVEGCVAQALKDVAACIAQVFERVARMVGQAAAVGEQIAQAQAGVVLRLGVGQREAGQQALDGRVPIHAGGHLRSHHSCGEGLGDRGELEHRVRIHGLAAVYPAQAEALGIHRLTTMHHRNSHAGHAGALHPLRHQGVEPRGGLAYRAGGGPTAAVAATAGHHGSSKQRGGSEMGKAKHPHGQLPKSSSSQSMDTAAE